MQMGGKSYDRGQHSVTENVIFVIKIRKLSRERVFVDDFLFIKNVCRSSQLNEFACALKRDRKNCFFFLNFQ